MAVIYKYPLDHGANDVPGDAASRVLSVGQDPYLGNLAVWVMHQTEPELLMSHIELQVVFTGEEFTQDWLTFVGTAHVGGFMCHVFERKR